MSEFSRDEDSLKQRFIQPPRRGRRPALYCCFPTATDLRWVHDIHSGKSTSGGITTPCQIPRPTIYRGTSPPRSEPGSLVTLRRRFAYRSPRQNGHRITRRQWPGSLCLHQHRGRTVRRKIHPPLLAGIGGRADIMSLQKRTLDSGIFFPRDPFTAPQPSEKKEPRHLFLEQSDKPHRRTRAAGINRRYH